MKRKAKKVGTPAPFLKKLFKGVGKVFGVDVDAAEKQAREQARNAEANAIATRQAQAVQAQAVRLQEEQMRQRAALAERAAEALKLQPAVAEADISVGTSGAEATASRKRRTQFFAQGNTGIGL